MPRKPTGMRAAAAGVPGLDRYREPRGLVEASIPRRGGAWRFKRGAWLTMYERTVNADENVGMTVALFHGWH